MARLDDFDVVDLVLPLSAYAEIKAHADLPVHVDAILRLAPKQGGELSASLLRRHAAELAAAVWAAAAEHGLTPLGVRLLAIVRLLDYVAREAPPSDHPATDSGKTLAHTVKVTLRDVDPPVWRRIRLESGDDLEFTSLLIKECFDWWGDHEWEFTYPQPPARGRDPAPPAEIADDYALVRQALPAIGSRLTFDYDQPDGWEHEVLVEDIDFIGSAEPVPECLAGARACPPENCRGSRGYRRMLEIMRNPTDPEYDVTVEWAGPFDPGAFDLEDTGHRLFRWFLAPDGDLDVPLVTLNDSLALDDVAQTPLFAAARCYLGLCEGPNGVPVTSRYRMDNVVVDSWESALGLEPGRLCALLRQPRPGDCLPPGGRPLPWLPCLRMLPTLLGEAELTWRDGQRWRLDDFGVALLPDDKAAELYLTVLEAALIPVWAEEDDGRPGTRHLRLIANAGEGWWSLGELEGSRDATSPKGSTGPDRDAILGAYLVGFGLLEMRLADAYDADDHREPARPTLLYRKTPLLNKFVRMRAPAEEMANGEEGSQSAASGRSEGP